MATRKRVILRRYLKDQPTQSQDFDLSLNDENVSYGIHPYSLLGDTQDRCKIFPAGDQTRNGCSAMIHTRGGFALLEALTQDVFVEIAGRGFDVGSVNRWMPVQHSAVDTRRILIQLHPGEAFSVGTTTLALIPEEYENLSMASPGPTESYIGNYIEGVSQSERARPSLPAFLTPQKRTISPVIETPTGQRFADQMKVSPMPAETSQPCIAGASTTKKQGRMTKDDSVFPGHMPVKRELSADNWPASNLSEVSAPETSIEAEGGKPLLDESSLKACKDPQKPVEMPSIRRNGTEYELVNLENKVNQSAPTLDMHAPNDGPQSPQQTASNSHVPVEGVEEVRTDNSQHKRRTSFNEDPESKTEFPGTKRRKIAEAISQTAVDESQDSLRSTIHVATTSERRLRPKRLSSDAVEPSSPAHPNGPEVPRDGMLPVGHPVNNQMPGPDSLSPSDTKKTSTPESIAYSASIPDTKRSGKAPTSASLIKSANSAIPKNPKRPTPTSERAFKTPNPKKFSNKTSTPRSPSFSLEPTSSICSTRSVTHLDHNNVFSTASNTNPEVKLLFANSSSVGDSKQVTTFLARNKVKIVQRVEDCTHLCIGRDAELKKTSKFVLAVLQGKEVITDDWVTQSVSTGKLPDIGTYLARDAEREAEWDINLDAAIERGRQGVNPLQGWNIAFTPTAKKEAGKSGFAELKEIAKCAGACNFSGLLPKSSPEELPSTLVIASSGGDDAAASALQDSGWRCFTRDVISLSVLRGDLDISGDEFEVDREERRKEGMERKH